MIDGWGWVVLLHIFSIVVFPCRVRFPSGGSTSKCNVLGQFSSYLILNTKYCGFSVSGQVSTFLQGIVQASGGGGGNNCIV